MQDRAEYVDVNADLRDRPDPSVDDLTTAKMTARWACSHCHSMLGKVVGDAVLMRHGRTKIARWLPVERRCETCENWNIYPPDADREDLSLIWFSGDPPPTRNQTP